MKTPIPHPDSFQQTGKQPIILFALSLIFALSILLPDKCLAQEKEAYVVIKNGEITFFYTLPENKPTDNVYSIPDGYGEHNELLPTIKTATFDDSFSGYEPKSCSSWFYNFTELTTINNLQNLNTNQVEDMKYMFYSCSSLIDIDLSQFNTGKVKNMSYMFHSCSSLTELDLKSFKTSNVTDMERMFCDCHNLITIDTGDGWKTQGVVNMTGMFQGCNNLNFNLINNLNTSSVQHMSYMFNSCVNISKLDLSFLDTKNVLDMQGMFAGCRKLDTIILDPNKFKTDQVEDMGWMFSGCNKLNYIDFSLFNTSRVQQIQYMFTECEGFTVLDLRSFKTPYVTDMHGMFKDCVNLTTILVSDDWNLTNLAKDNELYNTPIFENCPNLIGNNGTQYTDPNSPQFNTNSAYTQCHQDINYANANDGYFTKDSYKIFYDLDGDGNIDNNLLSLYQQWEEDTGTPETSFPLEKSEDIKIPNPTTYYGKTFKGWRRTPITDSNEPKPYITIPADEIGNRIYTAVWAYPYVVIDDDDDDDYTMTFFFKEDKPDNALPIQEREQDPNWSEVIRKLVKKAVFDESFKYYKTLKDCSCWFCGLENLTEIRNLDYLNTENVEDMELMFKDCSNLEKLDLTNFNTKKVKNMLRMFWGCSNLKTIDIGEKFTTENVIDMGGLFCNCSNLKFDFNKLNTSKVENMSYMFSGMSNDKTIDLHKFDTQKVRDMDCMFGGCLNLQKIIIDPNSFKTDNVQYMNSMFYNCTKLPEIDLSGFNTTKVEDMTSMFSCCKSLKVLDLRSFDTKKVTRMNSMFSECDSLTTILVSDKWSTEGIPDNTQSLFYECNNLIGNLGTKPTNQASTIEYAIVDAVSKPGYLTKDSYKIFYDLDGDGEIDDISNASWENNDNPKNFFPINNAADITISQHPIRNGYVFKGWAGTPITGLTYEKPSDNITIKKGDVGNRIYTAIWAPDLDIPETLSIPPVPGDIIDFCQNDNRSASFTVQLIDDWEITDCQISIPGFTAEYTPIPNDKECIITIASPEGTIPGRYQGNITLNQNDNTSYPITVDVTAVKGVVLHLYKDVIFVNNKGSIYKSSGYQWYKDGAEIPNANRQYLYDEEMSNDHTYMARMVTEKDDLTVYACEIPGGVDIAKSSPTPVKTYPNPAADGQEFSIEIMDFDPEVSYAIKISNSNGVIVKEIHDATQISTIALPRGVYSGALISGGRKKGFKLIVR